MKNEKLNKFFKYLFIVLGGAVTANGVLSTFISNVNLGIFLTYGFGLALLLCGIFWNKIHLSVRIIAASVTAAVSVFVICLFACGNADNVTYQEDAVIVLGAGIRGEKVSGGLKARLDRAAEYHSENPDAIIVVSGGQGPQEDITEALAMERYLLEKGIPEDKILKEERATSTNENFRFSKELLDEKLGGDYSVAFVTTDYHIYRAENIASSEGFEKVTHCHCDSKFYTVVPSGLREMCAVLKMWVFD